MIITEHTVPPKEMTKEEIKEIVQKFVDAARRAKEAGYDGVEIHSAHAYLLNQFYSPLTNKRTDEYGGALENRLRIHREVLQAVRAEVGHDYAISVRLGGYDDMAVAIRKEINVPVLLTGGVKTLDEAEKLIADIK